ncbi:MAG: DUF2490 domain-containing protein [Algoriphagus aquaeductus]|uniref:DUF2490 domain-containing protein n=2 Tax=Algoriphagus TaxID=246875 RepID=UPI003879EC5A
MKKTFFWIFPLFLVLVTAPFSTQAQYETRIWNSYSVVMPLQKDLSLRGTYMKSLAISESPVKTSFNWYSLRLNYKYNKDWNFELGGAWMGLPGRDRTTFRTMVEGTHRMVLNKKFVLRNSLQLEAHNDQEPRFDYRAIYSSRLGLRKRLDLLKVAPSITYSLFYNLGGDPIRYFNDRGEQIARKAANGLHRGRIMANFNFKVSDPIRLSVYYINQHEFNLVFSETNKINVLNPTNGRIQRPFNNQHILGISLSYQLKGNGGEGFLPINF